eukprot:3467611-Rhodomonas_salina.3
MLLFRFGFSAKSNTLLQVPGRKCGLALDLAVGHREAAAVRAWLPGSASLRARESPEAGELRQKALVG